MENKLKTLKDIEEDIAGSISIESDNSHVVVYPEELKQEAIKHIKEANEKWAKVSASIGMESENKIAPSASMLMTFLNITEEDLK